MKTFYEMTLKEAIEYQSGLHFAQPKAEWDKLAVGNIIMHKGQAWHITDIPPKRGFVMATNIMTGEAEKLLRSKYDGDDLQLTDEATLAILRMTHQEEIGKAVAAGIGISLQVQYDYPEIFTPFPESWDKKRREKAHELWRRINEMRYFHDRQDRPGWQLRKVDALKADVEGDIASWEAYRAEVEAGVNIKKPEAIPRIIASVNDTISDLKAEIETLDHLRKHLEKTVSKGETK